MDDSAPSPSPKGDDRPAEKPAPAADEGHRQGPLGKGKKTARKKGSKKKKAKAERNLLPLGSVEWIDHVRTSPPVRDPHSKGRATHRARPISANGDRITLEGHELTAYLFLEILKAAGLLLWFKPQPFELDEDVHGVEAIPDFIFKWFDQRLFVPEVKAFQYVTRAVEEKAEKLTNILSAAGMTYLLWRTKHELTTALWHNVRAVRQRQNIFVDDVQLQTARTLVDQGEATFGSLASHGVDPDVVLNQVGQGRMHFNLLEVRNDKTAVTRRANQDNYRALLGGRPDPDSWWNALRSRQLRQ